MLEFDGFIETSRIASYDLQRYNSHIGRAVDNVLATTRWTMRNLDDIADREASRGRIHHALMTLRKPFLGGSSSETAVLNQYVQHARTVEDELNRLIAEAQALLSILGNLEDRLDVIHGIVTRDKSGALASKDDLSQLWLLLGRNRKQLGLANDKLNLLDDVGRYRRLAVRHVTDTLMRLQEISAGIEDLRERVVAPELLRERSMIPLSVHLESIQRGVERLEMGRSNNQKLEGEYLRRTLDRGEPNDAWMGLQGASLSSTPLLP